MVIILDSFDEIIPDYSHKVEKLIRAIRDETESKLWITSRFPNRQELEDIVGKIALRYGPSHQKISPNSWNSTGVKLLKYPTKEICKILRTNYSVCVSKTSVTKMGNLPASLYIQ